MLAAQTQPQPSLLTDPPLWDTESGTAAFHNDNGWLLSFIDILALLLTLFVLLLAYEANGPDTGDATSPVLEQQAVRHEVPVAAVVPAPQAQTQVPVPFTVLDSLEVLPVSAPASFPRPGPRVISPPIASTESVRDATATPQPLLPPTEASAREPAASGTKGQPQVAAGAGDKAAIDHPYREASPAAAAIAPSSEFASLHDATDKPAQEPPPGAVGKDTALSAQQALLDDLVNRGLQQRLEVTVHSGAVNLAIDDSILFRPASASLTGDGSGLLEELAAVLAELSYSLSVEGHTDNIPIQTARFPSNWELSSARAAVVTRKLIERGVAAGRIRAVGYGATRPRADNDTAEGRSRNRRVSFVLQVPSTD